jgi:NADPH:quinone reductase-like Zn-dependent oxidoreductase
MYAPGDVRVEDRPEPTIQKPTDAIIRLSATCVCGSDLWPYRGADPVDEPIPMGHENAGIVEDVGESAAAFDQRADRAALQTDEQITVPMSGHSAIGDPRWPLADQRLRGDMGSGFLRGSRPRHPGTPGPGSGR